jgi:hypothetical protein
LIAIGPTNIFFGEDELLAPLKEKDLKEGKEDTTALKETKKF